MASSYNVEDIDPQNAIEGKLRLNSDDQIELYEKQLKPEARKTLWVNEMRNRYTRALAGVPDEDIAVQWGLQATRDEVERYFGRNSHLTGEHSPAAKANKLSRENPVKYKILRAEAQNLGLIVPDKPTLREQRMERFGHV